MGTKWDKNGFFVVFSETVRPIWFHLLEKEDIVILHMSAKVQVQAIFRPRDIGSNGGQNGSLNTGKHKRRFRIFSWGGVWLHINLFILCLSGPSSTKVEPVPSRDVTVELQPENVSPSVCHQKFSGTALRILFILHIQLGEHNRRRITEPDFS